MASTWGSSWGTSWALSWEHRAAPLARPTTWHDPGYHIPSLEDWEKAQVSLPQPWERKQAPPKSIPAPQPIVIKLPPEVREEDEINDIVHMLSWLDENGYLDDDDET